MTMISTLVVSLFTLVENRNKLYLDLDKLIIYTITVITVYIELVEAPPTLKVHPNLWLKS